MAVSIVVPHFLILILGGEWSHYIAALAWFYEQSNSPEAFSSPLFSTHTQTNIQTWTTDKHTHTLICTYTYITPSQSPSPPVICPAIRPTGSRGLLSEWGVPDPLSVRNTSLNPDALTRLHSAWKAKSLFQLGPACLAAIDFVTMGKSSVKSRSKSLRESFNYFFSLLLLKLKATVDSALSSSPLSCHG